ncbi:MAG: HD family phosphohydrolase, partial [Eubacterium sp.]
YLLGNHHSYYSIDGDDYQILVEADFLVNIYEDNLDQAAIQSAEKKIFKTETGLQILHDMFKD